MDRDVSKSGMGSRGAQVVGGAEYIEPGRNASVGSREGNARGGGNGDYDEELKKWRTDDQIIRDAEAMAPHGMLMLARLRLLSRVVSKKVPDQVRMAIVAAAPAKRSWFRALVRDLVWWLDNTDQGAGYRGKEEMLFKLMMDSPGRFVKVVIKGLKEDGANTREVWAGTKKEKTIR